MSGTSSSPSPPVYLLPDFDPSKAKVAELRGILLVHNIPYTSNAKKTDLVKLFKTKVLPLVPQLLKELSAVRASDDGVLDGNSLDGSLRELDTDPEEEGGDSATSTTRKDGKKRKSKRKSMVGRLREAAEEQESEEDGGREKESRSPRKKSSKRKEVAEEEEYPAEYDEVVPLAGEPGTSSNPSPKKRKAAPYGDEGTPRSASALKARRRTIQSEGEAGFSDYNPFQSGGEETPGRDLKRRKSSLNPAKERRSTLLDQEPVAPSSPVRAEPAPAPAPVPSTSTFSPAPNRSLGTASPAKRSTSSTRPDLTTANSWSSSTPEEARQRLLNPDGARRATMGPSAIASTKAQDLGKAKARASVGGSGGTPIGVKFMASMDKVKTSPPEAQRLMREFEETKRREREKAKRKQDEEDEEERKRLERELEEAEQEVKRLERERDEAMDLDRDQYYRSEGDVNSSVAEEDQDMDVEEEEEDEFIEEQDPFEGGEQEEDFEEEELFGESAPAPPPVVAALRQERTSTPRRSAPTPYSPREAQLQAQQSANTPRRSFPLPTPPASSSRRQLVPAHRKSLAPKEQQQQAIAVRSTSSSVSPISVRTARQVSSWSILLLTIVYSLWWREEKLAVGFCDTSSSSNELVSRRSTSLALPSLPSSLCTTLETLHLRPTCTPCPPHGFCQEGQFVGCTIDYVPRASPLRLGGLLPIAPRCVPDTEKLMVVAMQASKASKLLRKRRGEVVCGGLERLRRKQMTSLTRGEGDREAFVYGLQADNVLSALIRENEASKSPFSEEVIEELNRLALNDLVNHGEVLTWQDGDDYWYASKTAEMPLSCQARLAAIKSAKKHKTGLAGVLSALLSMLYLRYKLQARVQEKQRVAELVQTALVQLQRQERSHHSDPVLVPFPHIAPSHLRDLILQHVHSPTRRAQLWKRVEKIVEGNSNVRVMEVEQNGEELRGWQWVGATTGPSTREIEGPKSEASSVYSSPEKKPEMFMSGRSVLNAAR